MKNSQAPQFKWTLVTSVLIAWAILLVIAVVTKIKILITILPIILLGILIYILCFSVYVYRLNSQSKSKPPKLPEEAQSKN